MHFLALETRFVYEEWWLQVSRTQFIWINWNGELLGYAENPGNLIFL